MLKDLKGYLFLIFIEGISQLGSSLTVFALNIWAWQTYGVVSAISSVTISFYLPMLILGPIAGIFVDRLNRKSILIVTNIFLAITIGILSIFIKSGSLALSFIYIFGFIHAMFTSIRQPTIVAVMATMVDKEQLKRVNGIVQSVKAISSVAGPFLGAVFINIIGAFGIIMVDAVTFLVVAIGVSIVAIPRVKKIHSVEENSNNLRSIFIDLIDGWKFLVRNKGLLLIVIVDFAANFFGAFLVVLLLPMASEVWTNNFNINGIVGFMSKFSSGDSLADQIYGVMNTMLFVGVFIGSILMSTWGGFKNDILNLFIGFVFTGLTQAFVASDSINIALIAIVLSGIAAPAVNVTMQAIFMRNTPHELQGRVFSTLDTIAQISYPLGLFVVGILADKISSQSILFASGIIAAIVSAVFFINPKLRNYEGKSESVVEEN